MNQKSPHIFHHYHLYSYQGSQGPRSRCLSGSSGSQAIAFDKSACSDKHRNISRMMMAVTTVALMTIAVIVMMIAVIVMVIVVKIVMMIGATGASWRPTRVFEVHQDQRFHVQALSPLLSRGS